MTRHAWLIPIDPVPALMRATLSVLNDSAITYTVLRPDDVRDQLDIAPPTAAILHGGGICLDLFDVQRWLAEFRVPTLVLVEGLTDRYEASLLDRGARDVVQIPASTSKLRSRLDALLREPPSVAIKRPSPPGSVPVNDFMSIQPAQRVVEVGSQQVRLTRSEFDLLLALALAQGTVLHRRDLAEALGRTHLSDRALESHISRIRLKLRAAGAPDCIASVRSVGYRLQAAS